MQSQLKLCGSIARWDLLILVAGRRATSSLRNFSMSENSNGKPLTLFRI